MVDNMIDTEQELREKVVAEALTWLNTPFHDHAAVKGAGVDCLHFLYAVYHQVGLVGEIEIPVYSPQWWANRNEDRLREAIKKIGGIEFNGPPQPADVVSIKYGRVFAHAAIVIEWPWVIHAHPQQSMVRKSNAAVQNLFVNREKTFFSYWPVKKDE